MTEAWRKSVERHRETLEKLADGDGPLADDAKQLLDEYENAC